MIYLIEAVGTGYVKIGYCEYDPHDRVTALQVGCPFELRLVDTCPGSYEVERSFHGRFAHHHHRGEWFSDADSIRKAFQTNEMSCGGCGSATRIIENQRGDRRFYCPKGCSAQKVRHGKAKTRR